MLSFLKEYIMHPRSVGAVAPSGKNLSIKMMEPINFEKADVIVEYGPGTGSFSRELVKRKKEGTVLILIEQNEKFCEILNHEFKDIKNVHIVKDSAENVIEILKSLGFDHADYIVSGLPFTSLPKNVSLKIFNETKKIINKGYFITFQYSKVKRHFFEKYFDFQDILRVLKNLPPAYVFVLKNKK